MGLRLGYRSLMDHRVATGSAILENSKISAHLEEKNQDDSTIVQSSVQGKMGKYLAWLTKTYQDTNLCPVRYGLIRLPWTRHWFGFYIVIEKDGRSGIDQYFEPREIHGLGLAWASRD